MACPYHRRVCRRETGAGREADRARLWNAAIAVDFSRATATAAHAAHPGIGSFGRREFFEWKGPRDAESRRRHSLGYTGSIFRLPMVGWNVDVAL